MLVSAMLEVKFSVKLLRLRRLRVAVMPVTCLGTYISRLDPGYIFPLRTGFHDECKREEMESHQIQATAETQVKSDGENRVS